MNTDSIENLPGEEWRDIEGYEGYYQVSNKGRVKSLERIDSNNHPVKEKILKQCFTNCGYLRVGLRKDGKLKLFLVHRLVAEAFIPNPNDFPCVNHKSERKTENNVKNLEWISVKDNNNFGTRNERMSKAKTNNPKISTPIKCFDFKTNEETIYPSIMEAARNFNVSSSSIYNSLKHNKSPYKNRYIFSEA